MTHNAPSLEQQAQTERDLDPNVKQRLAADPQNSVWVAASAGTGKTKVLTDRVLRLLLPRKNGSDGTAPERILCITFTKAGANEMSLRIQTMLSQWAIFSDEKLDKALRDLLGYDPCAKTIEAARQLFAAVIDTAGGLKIMTIHAFCQSVLSRFPLEAGLSPSFKVIEEKDITRLLTQAKDHIVTTAHTDKDLQNDLNLIVEHKNEDQFTEIITALNSNRTLFAKVSPYRQDRYAALCNILGLDPADTKEKITQDFCDDSAFDINALYDACRHLNNGTAKDQDRGQTLQRWLEADNQQRQKLLPQYFSVFLTTKNAIFVTLATKGALQSGQHIKDVLQREAERVYSYIQHLKNIDIARATNALLNVGHHILQEYNKLKSRQSALDFDDLIFKTHDLLRTDGVAPWVMYKLDGGLDHVLVDEAQDTNPEQWQIVKHLCTDFFSGAAGRHDDTQRTIFTVGDEKQSIYSFQRAEPEEFARMKAHFEEKIKGASLGWENPALDISFRSTPSVLALTDEVFKQNTLRRHLGDSYKIEAVSHKSFHHKEAGYCEIWPLTSAEDTSDEQKNWAPPIEIRDYKSAPAKLAEKIAFIIHDWLDKGRVLDAKARPIEPQDIMILVRTRTAFVNQLMKALKCYNIPVSGLDRMKLNEQIAIMDLKALATFALNPYDDLTLASILKSPFIGYNEEQLYDLAIDRTSSLWNSLRDTASAKDITAYLQRIINLAQTERPSNLFQTILNAPCPANTTSGLRAMQNRIGPDCLDPLEEFLNLVINYEHNESPSLQGFLIAQQNNTQDIKREMEEARQEVRIMTVHASKGLQAPIVFLPDTVRSKGSQKPPLFLTPPDTGLQYPLWSPNSDMQSDFYAELKNKLTLKNDAEYSRLLYVAMTRAEYELYVCGAKGKKNLADESWYSYIADAFDTMDNVTTHEDGRLSVNNPQLQTPQINTQDSATDKDSAITLPSHFYEIAPKEPDPPKIMSPSRPSESEPAVISPLDVMAHDRFLRGNLTHDLLQFLPDIEQSAQEAAIDTYLGLHAAQNSDKFKESIKTEILRILHNPAYQDIFGEKSKAEIPITGYVGRQMVSGQIDRLYIDRDRKLIKVLDYKTNRPPPTDPKDIPAIYIRQMRAYRDTLAEIYDDYKIESYLLWTDGPNLMQVPL